MLENRIVDNDLGGQFKYEEKLSFENVSFAYDQNVVLDQISFSIKKGESIAFVGDSGAGKSTIISLILRVIDPEKGTVAFDGKSINSISKNSLYQSVALVSQDCFLYNDSIRENIVMGRENVSDVVIKDCLRIANAYDFVMNLEQGLDTVIGDEGSLLSGGEKQRLTIARALIENPELILLDEPTSALDPVAEKNVSAAIAKAMEGRTSIIIAHKLSTIRNVDKILVLDKGKIIEAGTHHELVESDGFYSRYVNLQSLD